MSFTHSWKIKEVSITVLFYTEEIKMLKHCQKRFQRKNRNADTGPGQARPRVFALMSLVFSIICFMENLMQRMGQKQPGCVRQDINLATNTVLQTFYFY